MYCKNVLLESQMPMYGKFKKGTFRIVFAKIVYTAFGGRQYKSS